MIAAVRLSQTRFLANAFSGQGAKDFGGRWNSIGTAVVYCSDCLSLATLEILVQTGDIRDIINLYSWILLEFEESLVEHLSEGDLPTDWMTSPVSSETQMLGNQWVHEQRSPVLSVPSAVIPQQRNFLLNPFHPGFAEIRIAHAKAQRFAIDPRLLNDGHQSD